jgi:hypothetical protein
MLQQGKDCTYTLKWTDTIVDSCRTDKAASVVHDLDEREEG